MSFRFLNFCILLPRDNWILRGENCICHMPAQFFIRFLEGNHFVHNRRLDFLHFVAGVFRCIRRLSYRLHFSHKLLMFFDLSLAFVVPFFQILHELLRPRFQFLNTSFGH